ncbi:inorganic phosphate transporter [Suttonella ornithocola]|uniref:Phosphate transporter n=1 Tax=Suttonella ornithocola TaxID=279832 RepID=A0A380MUN4_9GAMM|nr:inorganic phosphate transporter [Suttonella ornithocola]SUO95067.1 Low-affinity inorganic phosphate transporter 1 [Suttonella ornithocola]
MKKINSLSLTFAIVLTLSVSYFLYWGYGYTGANSSIWFIAAALFGLFMAFNIGGNDVANSFGTSVGAKTLTITQALCIAAVFEISGAVFAGGEVTSTIRSGIIDLNQFSDALEPMQFIKVMMSALIAAAFWLLFATRNGLPVSTTHSIIGGIVGAGITLSFILENVHASSVIRWSKIGEIAASWIISPLLGGIVAYLLYAFIKRYILNFNERAEAHLRRIREDKDHVKMKAASILLSEIQQSAYGQVMSEKSQRKLSKLDDRQNSFNPHAALQIWAPMLAAGGAMIMAAMLLFKGLKHLNLNFNNLQNTLIIIGIGIAAWLAISLSSKYLRRQGIGLTRSTFVLFSWMQVFTACGFAFSHGSNDIANAVGPFAAILDTLRTNSISQEAAIPTTVMLTFGIALIAGLWFIGKNVIATVGTNLTKMHPSSGFTAELSAAGVVMLASALGLPVSSTHILVGAVLGVGLVNKNANWRLMKPIALAWVVTVPAAAAISALAFMITYYL